jgi:plasmid stability protein
MGRFYFHLRREGELVTDDEGTELPNVRAARREAEQGAREMLAEAIKAGGDTIPDAFIVADEHGREVDTVLLATLLPKPLRK